MRTKALSPFEVELLLVLENVSISRKESKSTSNLSYVVSFYQTV